MLTAQQQQTRLEGISGSEIAAVLGLSTFRRPIDVWREKRGYAPLERIENADMQRGRLLEPCILQWYIEETGLELRYHGKAQQTFVSDRHPLVRATPDSIAYRRDGNKSIASHCVEAKAPNIFALDDWGAPGTDAVRPQYILQAHWQMEATGIHTYVDMPVFVGDAFRMYHVDWNQRLFDAALAKATDWWDEYVVADTVPPLDGSPSSKAWLQSLFPGTIRKEKSYIDGTEHSALIDQYATARELAKAAVTEEQRLAHEIMAIIGDADGMDTARGKILWTHCKGRTTINWQAIAKAMGGASKELIDEHTKTGKPSRQFRPQIKRK